MKPPIIRMATPEENAAIMEAIVADLNNGQDTHTFTTEEVASHDTYIRENYVSDGPGYVGMVAIVHFGGGPGIVSTFVRRGGRWVIEVSA